jgi:hypothetical protein
MSMHTRLLLPLPYTQVYRKRLALRLLQDKSACYKSHMH